MKKLHLLLILILASTSIYAQNFVQGIIKNLNTGELVQYASLSVKNTNQGTVSNEQGNFSIDIKLLPATLIISCIGYKREELTVTTNIPLTISLRPATIALQEVIVGDPALAIMKEVAIKAKKESQQYHLLKTFFRQTSIEGDEPVFFSESFMDAKWQNWSLTDYCITNSRYLEANPTISYNNMVPFSFACSGYVNNNLITYPVNRRPDSLYKFKIKEMLKMDGREIAVITCALKSNYFKQKAFIGDYYVDTESYAVLKIEGSLANFRMTASAPFSIKVREVMITAQFKTLPDSSDVLDYVTLKVVSSFKAGFVGLKQLTYNAKLFNRAADNMIDIKTLSPVSIGHLQTDHDRFVNSVYDAEFWKKNATVRRTDDENLWVEKLEKIKKVKGTLIRQ